MDGTYRDPREAALAQAESLRRENERLRRELDARRVADDARRCETAVSEPCRASPGGRSAALPVLGVLLASALWSKVTSSPPDPPPASLASLTPASVPATSPAQAPVSDLRRPDVVIPDGPPPAVLRVTDLRTGTGPEVRPGRVEVRYVGVAWSTRREIDSSWERSAPFTFNYGAGQVIAGWERGLAGMRVGGRRLLVIPPALAYGDRGAGHAIAPRETLVFVVDLLALR